MKKSFSIKQIGLVVLASASMVLASMQVNAADERNKNINHQHLSKRPYQAAPEASASEPKDQWEGATYINDENKADNLPTKHQQMRINMLGRHPYMEKAGE